MHGFTFFHNAELVPWFKDRNGKIAIFADAVAILQSIGATHSHNLGTDIYLIPKGFWYNTGLG